MDNDSRDFILLCGGGANPGAAMEVPARHRGLIYILCKRYFPNPADTEDTTCEVILHAGER
jgi:hypothetical protein